MKKDKRANNNLENNTQKIKALATQTSLTTDVNSRAPPITAPLVTNNRCELAGATNYCSTSY